MNTGEVLDLFTVSAEGDPRKKKEPGAGGGGSGSVSASKVLEGYVSSSLSSTLPCVDAIVVVFEFRLVGQHGHIADETRLEDLQPEDEYADLSLSNFMSKV